MGDISTRTLRGQGREIRGQKSKRVRVREKGSVWGDAQEYAGDTDLPLLQKSRHVGIVVIADVLLFPWRWGGLAGSIGRVGFRRREQQKVRGTEKQ